MRTTPSPMKKPKSGRCPDNYYIWISFQKIHKICSYIIKCVTNISQGGGKKTFRYIYFYVECWFWIKALQINYFLTLTTFHMTSFHLLTFASRKYQWSMHTTAMQILNGWLLKNAHYRDLSFCRICNLQADKKEKWRKKNQP